MRTQLIYNYLLGEFSIIHQSGKKTVCEEHKLMVLESSLAQSERTDYDIIIIK